MSVKSFSESLVSEFPLIYSIYTVLTQICILCIFSGILKREDLNAKELRNLADTLEKMNIDKLAKGTKLTNAQINFKNIHP